MNKKLLSLLLAQALSSLALLPAFGQSPWVAVPNVPNYLMGFPYGDVTYITAPQPNVLWGVFNGYQIRGVSFLSVFRTIDNGLTWESTPSGVDLSVQDAQAAWLLDYDAANAPYLRHTVSGPSGFVNVVSTLPAGISKIHFFTASIGIAATESFVPGVSRVIGPLYRTTDAGATWTLASPAPPTLAGTFNPFTAKYAVGNSLWLSTYNGDILRTADAGLTWTTTPALGKVAFEDALHGLAYNQNASGQQLFRTADGGISWAPVAYTGQPLFKAITAVPGSPGTYISAGYVSGFYDAGVSSISRDRGTTWQIISTDNLALSKLVAVSATEIWAATDTNQRSLNPSNLLWRYAGTALPTKNPTDPSQLVAAYPNPTSGTVQLTGPLQGEEELRVYNAAGQLCQRGKVSESRRTVDLSAQGAGLYQLVLTSSNGTVRSQRVSKN